MVRRVQSKGCINLGLFLKNISGQRGRKIGKVNKVRSNPLKKYLPWKFLVNSQIVVCICRDGILSEDLFIKVDTNEIGVARVVQDCQVSERKNLKFSLLCNVR